MLSSPLYPWSWLLQNLHLELHSSSSFFGMLSFWYVYSFGTFLTTPPYIPNSIWPPIISSLLIQTSSMECRWESLLWLHSTFLLRQLFYLLKRMRFQGWMEQVLFVHYTSFLELFPSSLPLYKYFYPFYPVSIRFGMWRLLSIPSANN